MKRIATSLSCKSAGRHSHSEYVTYVPLHRYIYIHIYIHIVFVYRYACNENAFVHLYLDEQESLCTQESRELHIYPAFLLRHHL